MDVCGSHFVVQQVIRYCCRPQFLSRPYTKRGPFIPVWCLTLPVWCRETLLPEFLIPAIKAADYFVAHLPSDYVPLWDFQVHIGAIWAGGGWDRGAGCPQTLKLTSCPHACPHLRPLSVLGIPGPAHPFPPACRPRVASPLLPLQAPSNMAYKDTSAASAAASGLIELDGFAPGRGYLLAANRILTSLMT